MEIKTIEQYVLEGLENKERARTDDFFLYGYVLRKLGIDLLQPIAKFLADAKEMKYPTFETVTRCRRHIQELRPDLKDKKTAYARADKIQEFKDYNLSDIGE